MEGRMALEDAKLATPRARKTARPRMPAIHTRNLSEQVAEGIVAGIARGRFQPGERLIEEDIADELGVSRFPVRSALKMLAKQGVVVLQPNRGARVVDLDHTGVLQFAEIRCDLECRAAGYAMARLVETPELGKGLDAIVATMEKAARRGDRKGVREADMAFHAWIFQAADNHLLQMMWETLAKHMTIVFSFGRADDDLVKVAAEHGLLRDHIAAGDAEAYATELHRQLVDDNRYLNAT